MIFHKVLLNREDTLRRIKSSNIQKLSRLLSLALLLSLCAMSAIQAASGPATAHARAVGDQTTIKRAGGKLSPRLYALAQPATQLLSTAMQAEQLSLSV